jgi:tRNA (guanine-N7-)-methyltransferase
MSARREYALSELLPNLEVSLLDRPIDLTETLQLKSAIVDFGSGMGDHTLELAAKNPMVGILAIDVHTVGLLAIAETATRREFHNIRTHHGDGMDVVKTWLKPESIDEIHILFPDPWPKARHHKRRLINSAFLEIASRLLKPGGQIIFVTDDESYFESAQAAFVDSGLFALTFNDWDVPMTTYHKRALSLDHTVSQLRAVIN